MWPRELYTGLAGLMSFCKLRSPASMDYPPLEDGNENKIEAQKHVSL